MILYEHDFLVWLRSGSNSADINRFQSYTGEKILLHPVYLCLSIKLSQTTKPIEFSF